MPQQITVRYWAGARRAAGMDRLATVVSFLVDGQQAGEATRLHDGAVVDVLPPFAGG